MQPQLTSDSDLSRIIAAASRGDQSAWREMIGLYGRRVFALVRSRVHKPDLAEELTQSVFATVAGKLGTTGYTEQGKFEAWLFRIAVNRIRDEVRRLKRHATPTDPVTFDGVSTAAPAQRVSETELAALRKAMGTLSDADREIIELRHHAGLPFATIAEMLDEPIGTLLARHHRALKKLKELLAGSDADDEPNQRSGISAEHAR
jgi:RNA polymerase sigma-70 factor (ECF subfamily)